MNIHLRITKNTPATVELAHSNLRSVTSLLLTVIAIIQSISLSLGGLMFVSQPITVKATLKCQRNYVRETEVGCELSQTETNFFQSEKRIVKIENLKEAQLKISQFSLPNSENTENYQIILLQKDSVTPFITGYEVEFGLNDTSTKVNKINAFIADTKQKSLTVEREKHPIILKSVGAFLILLVLISLALLISNLSKSFRIKFDKSNGILSIINERIGKKREQKYPLSRVESISEIKIPKNKIKHFKQLEVLQPVNKIPSITGPGAKKSNKQYFYLVALTLKSGQHLFLYYSSHPCTDEVNLINHFLFK